MKIRFHNAALYGRRATILAALALITTDVQARFVHYGHDIVVPWSDL
jgi:hypothetical protein